MLLGELLDEEVKFQEQKLKLIFLYLDLYDNAVDVEIQGEIAKQIMDLIELRPRYFLQGSYFTQSYWAHRNVLDQHYQTLNQIMTREKENIIPPLFCVNIEHGRDLEIYENIALTYKV